LSQLCWHGGHPQISPDGSRVAFRSSDGKKQPIYVTAVESPKPEMVCPDCGSPTDWSPDGRFVLFEPGATVAFAGAFDLEKRVKFTAASHPDMSIRGARFSRDGNWIVFHLETGPATRRIYAARFQENSSTQPAEWIPITDGEQLDIYPDWSPDGSRIYFLSDRGETRSVWMQTVNPATKRPIGGPASVLPADMARRSLLRNVRLGADHVGFHVLPNRLVFAMDEVRAEIWRLRR